MASSFNMRTQLKYSIRLLAVYGAAALAGVWLTACKPAELKVVSITASSYLVEPVSSSSYPPALLFDGDAKTTWSESKPGQGVGESITVTLNRPIKVDELGLINGFAKSTRLFLKNGRVNTLEVQFDGGKPMKLKVAIDTFNMQKLKLPKAASGKVIKLTIRGTTNGFPDTCVSEIAFFNAGKKITLPGIPAMVAAQKKEGTALSKQYRAKPGEYWKAVYGDQNFCDGYLCFRIEDGTLLVSSAGSHAPDDRYDLVWAGKYMRIKSQTPGSYYAMNLLDQFLVKPLNSSRVLLNGETYKLTN